MTLTWWRSWPETIPEGRAYVVDGLPRLVMRDCNYATLADYQPWPDDEPGFCLIEWDLALDVVSRDRFAARARRHPDRVLVAPYYLRPEHRLPVLVHRSRGKPIEWGEPRCEWFGFGCIYFPKAILDRWWLEMPARSRGKWNDTTFSSWLMPRYGPTDVAWDVYPQHLHGD
ncbi:MAG: hypothetical protein L0206_01135 [Actinobacteria bacterium]|nr:hypothetical protein [Actinomycetota bacterium]